jgi:hypothetical protein
MPIRSGLVLGIFAILCVGGLARVAAAPLTPLPLEDGASLGFADERARTRFLEYRRFLEEEPARYVAELATIDRLVASDIEYVVAVCDPLGPGIEGCLTTDGERVVINVTDVRGVSGDIASLNSRFAHELEHARQFDAGELALARDPVTGNWISDYNSYDIGDEVKAWTAQLRASSPRDYWRELNGMRKPTTLRRFASAADDVERARVLLAHGYARVNPLLDRRVHMRADAGLSAGDVVHPSAGHDIFGRLYAIVTLDPAAKTY